MDFSLYKEPLVWVMSGVMAIVWSVAANFITPKVMKWVAHFRKPKTVKNHEKSSKLLQSSFELEEDKTRRYELKLEAIHRELIGIALYLISFATLWVSIIIEPKLFVVFLSVLVFFIGTKILDSGVNMMNLAKLAASRVREIKSFKGSNLNSSKEELQSFIEQINVRDFGIKS